MMSDYDLVFFDLHTHPDDDFIRHKALGRMILEERPRNIISGGDLLSMDSCSFHDTNKRYSLKEDQRASQRGHDYIFGPLHRENKKKKKGPRLGVKTYCLLGNHEFRISRLAEVDPDGFSSIVDYNEIIAPPEYWDVVVEYGYGVMVNDVYYTHIPINKTGRPMAPTAIARQSKGHICFGHTHSFDVKTVPQISEGNSVRMVMNAPALLPQNEKEHYCKMSTTGWAYGLIKMRPNGPDQLPSYEYITTEDLINKYG